MRLFLLFNAVDRPGVGLVRREASFMGGVRADEARVNAIHALAGQVAVVTGASRGIGAAIAKELSSMGATAVLCGRSRGALESVARTITEAGGKAEVASCDVA